MSQRALYVTADDIGIPTGGGAVTFQESLALQEAAGGVEVWDGNFIRSMGDLPWSFGGGWHAPDWTYGDGELDEPWACDSRAMRAFPLEVPPTLAHFYSGTFSRTVARIRFLGGKVSYTAAAHRISDSRKAHEELGLSYNFPHLTDPELWNKYLQGYLDADLLICPSSLSAKVMTEYGREGPIAVIPHGCHLPKAVRPLPGRFAVGYLGAYGPDKGVVDLLRAWKILDYKDAVLLLGGRDSQSDWVHHLYNTYGGGNVECVGWVNDVSDFYNACSLYAQPSKSEGFGMEVLEACAHQRPVVCSRGAGACDLLPAAWTYDTGDVQKLALKIDTARKILSQHPFEWFSNFRRVAETHTWDVIRNRYATAWKCLLGGGVA